MLRIINEQTRLPVDVPIDKVLATGIRRELGQDITLITRDGAERSIANAVANVRNNDLDALPATLLWRDLSYYDRLRSRMFVQE